MSAIQEAKVGAKKWEVWCKSQSNFSFSCNVIQCTLMQSDRSARKGMMRQRGERKKKIKFQDNKI
jgi:hypothetical protein